MTPPLFLASRTMKARRTGTCPLCKGPIQVGQSIALAAGRWQHTGCLIEARTKDGSEENK